MQPVMRMRAAHRISGLLFSPDGQRLMVIATSFGDILEMFELTSGSRLWKRRARGTLSTRGTFSRDGELIAFGSNVHQASILRADSGELVTRANLSSYTQSFTHACISPDGEHLAYATADQLRICPVPARDDPLQIDLLDGWCHDIQFSPDGTHLATAGDSGVQLWNTQTGRPGPLLNSAHPVVSMRFSPCAHIVTALETSSKGRQRNLQSWALRTSAELSERPLPPTTQSAALSADGLLVLTRNQEGTVLFNDTTTGHALAGPIAIGSGRRATALSNDRQLLAIGRGRILDIVNPGLPPLPHDSGLPAGGICHECGLQDQPKN